jgi:hypothetical protein
VVRQARALLDRIIERTRATGKDTMIWKLIEDYVRETGDLASAENVARNAALLLDLRVLSLLCHRYFDDRVHAEWNENDRPMSSR